jgi:Tetracyclin repressor-like, C-terminal domain
MRSLSPREHQIVADLRDEYEGELKSILEDGIKRRLFTIVDVRVATFAILAMLTGLTAWYREGGRLSKTALVKCYVDLVSNGVGAAHIDRSRR